MCVGSPELPTDHLVCKDFRRAPRPPRACRNLLGISTISSHRPGLGVSVGLDFITRWRSARPQQGCLSRIPDTLALARTLHELFWEAALPFLRHPPERIIVTSKHSFRSPKARVRGICARQRNMLLVSSSRENHAAGTSEAGRTSKSTYSRSACCHARDSMPKTYWCLDLRVKRQRARACRADLEQDAPQRCQNLRNRGLTQRRSQKSRQNLRHPPSHCPQPLFVLCLPAVRHVNTRSSSPGAANHQRICTGRRLGRAPAKRISSRILLYLPRASCTSPSKSKRFGFRYTITKPPLYASSRSNSDTTMAQYQVVKESARMQRFRSTSVEGCCDS